MNQMEYKGYIGCVDVDTEAGLLTGQVIDTKDVITFQGTSVDELRQAFRDSVDDYLEFCRRRGEEPGKPFSGQFVTRIEPELHRLISIAASASGKSLNAWVSEELQKAVVDRGVVRGGKTARPASVLVSGRRSKEK